MNIEQAHKDFKKIITRVLAYFGCIFLAAAGVLFVHITGFSFNNSAKDGYYVYLLDYDVSKLGNSEQDRLVKLGYDMFLYTSKHIGPESANPYAGNKLACNNCHLLGGKKPYSAPLIGIINRFPQYRGREDKMGTIEERINGCMERSMNGRVLDENSEAMKAMVSYLEFLNQYAPKDGKIEGQGFVKVNFPDREIDLNNGERVFKQHCIECHQDDGQGKINTMNEHGGYEFPPLWGTDSYNNGAGMTRVLTSARFIKGNMPFGVTYEEPLLTDEEAFDVAGYINQQWRPVKERLEVDFPNLLKKPVSTPYPPYMDPFPIEQHQKGPFQPIMEYYKKTYNITKTK